MSFIISTIKKNIFPIEKPSAFLTCPNGNIMLIETIKHIDLINVEKIYIIVLKKDIEKYFYIEDFKSMFEFTNKPIIIDIIENNTENQPTTIYNCIKKNNIKGPIFIKDYKSIIEYCPVIENGVYYIEYGESTNNCISNLHNKSFIKFNTLNQIINISEKEILSNHICIGAYSFKNTKLFIDNYEQIIQIQNINNLYISHIIYNCILNNIIFTACQVSKFQDLSFYENWKKYCDKFKTLFIDIDGTLVLNSGEYSKKKWGETDQIKKNVDFLKDLYKTGTIQIILTTARKKKYEKQTIEQLKKFEIPYDNIIFDLFHCKRFLINDYAETNPYPSAIAINLSRNNDNLKDLL